MPLVIASSSEWQEEERSTIIIDKVHVHCPRLHHDLIHGGSTTVTSDFDLQKDETDHCLGSK
jgi:hypothetical protein